MIIPMGIEAMTTTSPEVHVAQANKTSNGGAEQEFPVGGAQLPEENGGAQSGMTDKECVHVVMEGFKLEVVKGGGQSATNGAAASIDKIIVKGKVPSLPAGCGPSWRVSLSEMQFGRHNGEGRPARGEGTGRFRRAIDLDSPLISDPEIGADSVEATIRVRQGRVKSTDTVIEEV